MGGRKNKQQNRKRKRALESDPEKGRPRDFHIAAAGPAARVENKHHQRGREAEGEMRRNARRTTGRPRIREKEQDKRNDQGVRNREVSEINQGHAAQDGRGERQDSPGQDRAVEHERPCEASRYKKYAIQG